MSDMVIQRLLWKEYRVQRGFWLSMAGIAVACQLIVLALPENAVSHIGWLFGLAFGIPAFYALGCGATLFAAEREDGTLEQLRVLAAPGWKVWWSKLGYCAVSTFCLLGLLWALAFNFSRGRMPDAESYANLGSVWGVLTMEFLAWGVFFSLVTKRPLNAACMAAVASLASSSVVSAFTLDSRSQLVPGGHIVPAVFWCFIQVIVLLVLDAWIALRWVLERPSSRRFRSGAAREQTPQQMFMRRAAFASVAAAAVTVFMAAIAGPSSFTIATWRASVPSEGLVLSGVTLAEAIAWGLLCSSLLRRTPLAVLCAAGSAAVSWQLQASLIAIFSGGRPLYIAPWTAVVSLRLWIVLILFIVIAWRTLRGWVALQDVSPLRGLPLAPRITMPLRRLVWQEGRQAWRTVVIFWAVAIVLLTFYRVFDPVRDGVSLVSGIVASVVLASLMGSCAFLAEQEGRRFRFFAEHGVGARRVWRSKQIVWLPAALVSAGALCLSTLASVRRSSDLFVTEILSQVMLLIISAYCCGQFASMLLSRGLVAGLTGILLSMAVVAWQRLTLYLGVGLWSVVPIPAFLLVATWLRAPDWILERNGWRAWLRLVALLSIPMIGLPVAVAVYRVYEIPAAVPGFTPDRVLQPVTAEQTETATMYRRAIALRVPMKDSNVPSPTNYDRLNVADDAPPLTAAERSWLEQNHASLQMSLEAARRASCVFYDPATRLVDSPMSDIQAMRELANLLLLEGRRRESDGDLANALECYLAVIKVAQHVSTKATGLQFLIGDEIEASAYGRLLRWVALPEQSPGRIRTAIAQLDALFQSAPQLSDSLMIDYVTFRRALTSDWANLAFDSGSDGSVSTAAIVLQYLPWEHRRAQRFLDYRASRAVQAVSETYRAQAANTTPNTSRLAWGAGYDEKLSADLWAQTFFDIRTDWTATVIHIESRRRALRIVLALKAWQCDHGELPTSLDSLAGEYLARIPLDPRSAKPFGYAPRGIDTPVRFDAATESLIKADQPLLWSAVAESWQNTYSRSSEGDRIRIVPGTGRIELYPIP